jgi:c-di-GMP-binding flagellar brake protein YcgR
MNKKRKNMRIPLSLNLHITMPTGKSYTGTTVNISFGGLLAKLDQSLESSAGGEYDLTIMLQAGAESIPLEFYCRIIHIHEDNVVFQFIYINGLISYTHFKNLMVFNCERPEELLAELVKNPGLSIEKE